MADAGAVMSRGWAWGCFSLSLRVEVAGIPISSICSRPVSIYSRTVLTHVYHYILHFTLSILAQLPCTGLNCRGQGRGCWCIVIDFIGSERDEKSSLWKLRGGARAPWACTPLNTPLFVQFHVVSWSFCIDRVTQLCVCVCVCVCGFLFFFFQITAAKGDCCLEIKWVVQMGRRRKIVHHTIGEFMHNHRPDSPLLKCFRAEGVAWFYAGSRPGLCCHDDGMLQCRDQKFHRLISSQQVGTWLARWHWAM